MNKDVELHRLNIILPLMNHDELLETIIAMATALAEQGLISEELAAEYSEGLEDSFEPSAYVNITPEALLADIKLWQKNQ